jgi:hypothetical protein
MSEGKLELGGVLVYRGLTIMNEGGLLEWGTLSEGTARGGPGWRAPLMGTPKDMLNKYIKVCKSAL